ncbi:hypothetical protein [Metabacillus sp. 84]|uniref:hypothetical protein n=1 Tax=Metabacillus sp. 84 TaxID=3404705 RepID=UPI003CF7BC5D
MSKRRQALLKLQTELDRAEASATEATRILNTMFDADYPDSSNTSSDSIEHLKEQMDYNMIQYKMKLNQLKKLLSDASG